LDDLLGAAAAAVGGACLATVRLSATDFVGVATALTEGVFEAAVFGVAAFGAAAFGAAAFGAAAFGAAAFGAAAFGAAAFGAAAFGAAVAAGFVVLITFFARDLAAATFAAAFDADLESLLRGGFFEAAALAGIFFAVIRRSFRGPGA
jgi:hypothetical protein